MAKRKNAEIEPVAVQTDELVVNCDRLLTDFNTVYSIIVSHRDRVVQQVNGETVMMVWEVGGYVSGKLKTSAWGSGVVRQLAEYIHTQDPTVRGWSYRTIYKMVQFYETYSSPDFIKLIGKVKPQFAPLEMAQISNRQIMPIQSAQIQPAAIVPIQLAQFPDVLLSTGWSNHQLIMNYCKTDEQRLFYMLYAGRERLEYKELDRAIKTDAMSAILNSLDVQSQVTQYKEQLQVGGVIQRSLVEFCKLVEESKKTKK